ncbi:response regulator transcription factor [Clostridioides difficile]|uniref:response regulator transcription factor n=1 Tax=Clostridioides difficile TaxID=1496 RepID=UPI0029C15765|nr:response regulator transcription factor [Clostridioides difficile]MDX5795591.1 response regulator transcription factor [Clostridioides difficile]
MQTKILIIDGDKDNCKKLKGFLEEKGISIDLAYNCEEAIGKIFSNKYDLIFLEIILSDGDGWTLCKKIRNVTTCPIVYMTYINEDQSILNALNSGGDDYLIKPLNLEILYAKVKAILRRMNSYVNNNENNTKLEEYNRTSGVIKLEDKIIKLTPTENKLLNFFIENPEKTLTTKEIYEHVWMNEYLEDNYSVVVAVNGLRKKIEKDYKNPQKIITIREVGYYFNKI